MDAKDLSKLTNLSKVSFKNHIAAPTPLQSKATKLNYIMERNDIYP